MAIIEAKSCQAGVTKVPFGFQSQAPKTAEPLQKKQLSRGSFLGKLGNRLSAALASPGHCPQWETLVAGPTWLFSKVHVEIHDEFETIKYDLVPRL